MYISTVLADARLSTNLAWRQEYLWPSFEFGWILIFLWVKLSWHSCSMWDKTGWLNWFWQFFCEGLSSFKDSITHMHDLAVYVKEEPPFAQDLLSLENSADSCLCFRLAFTSLSVLLRFPLSITFFIFMHSFWFYFIWNRWGSLNQPIC